MSQPSFNLIDCSWVPCADTKGRYELLGLREVLVRAHELREIEHQNPLSVAALLRLHLALVHRLVDGPKTQRDWVQAYQVGHFAPKQVDAYLERWRHRFDLFCPETPFYQTAGLAILNDKGGEAPATVSTIQMERSSGNNKTLFDHTTDGVPVRLSPAEAAQALVTAQMFALPGLNKKTTNFFGLQGSFRGAAMVSGIFIALSGASLFETLMLNLLLYRDDEPIVNQNDDCPVWESDKRAGGDEARDPRGYLHFLTPSCRHIRLLPVGDGEVLGVERIHIAQGEYFPSIVKRAANPGFMSKQDKEGRWYHPQLDVSRLLWRNSLALFAFDHTNDRRPKVFRQVAELQRQYKHKGLLSLGARYNCAAISLANEKASPIAWRMEVLAVPPALLEREELVANLVDAMATAEGCARVLEGVLKCFMQHALPKNSKYVAAKAKATGATSRYWEGLEAHFNHFLINIEDCDAAVQEWRKRVVQTVRETFRSVARHYAPSPQTLKAWTLASDQLDIQLGKFTDKRGEAA